MTREEFSALVARLQAVSEQQPRAYNIRVAGLTMLGYAFLFFVLGASVLITLAMIGLIILKPNFATIKLGLMLGLPPLPSATNRTLTVSIGNGMARYRAEVKVEESIQSSVPNYVKGVGATILRSATRGENGVLSINFQSLQPGGHRVQYSDNLQDWFTAGDLYWSGGLVWRYDEIYLPPAETRYVRTQQVY